MIANPLGRGRPFVWTEDQTRDTIGFTIWWPVPIVILTYASFLLLTASPTVQHITTVDTIPYVPANAEVVRDVTNVLVVSGSGNIFTGTSKGAGVGAPQVERSVEAYRQNDTSSPTFLVVKPDDDYETTTVHYYDPQPGRVIHAYYTYGSPAFHYVGRTAGYFSPTKARIEANKLVVDRTFLRSDAFNVTVIVIGGIAIVGWLVLANFTSYPIQDWIIRRLYYRNR